MKGICDKFVLIHPFFYPEAWGCSVMFIWLGRGGGEELRAPWVEHQKLRLMRLKFKGQLGPGVQRCLGQSLIGERKRKMGICQRRVRGWFIEGVGAGTLCEWRPVGWALQSFRTCLVRNWEWKIVQAWRAIEKRSISSAATESLVLEDLAEIWLNLRSVEVKRPRTIRGKNPRSRSHLLLFSVLGLERLLLSNSVHILVGKCWTSGWLISRPDRL